MARYRDTGHGPYIDSNVVLELPAVRKDSEEITVEISLSPISLSHAAEYRGHLSSGNWANTPRPKTTAKVSSTAASVQIQIISAAPISVNLLRSGLPRFMMPTTRSPSTLGMMTATQVRCDLRRTALLRSWVDRSKSWAEPHPLRNIANVSTQASLQLDGLSIQSCHKTEMSRDCWLKSFGNVPPRPPYRWLRGSRRRAHGLPRSPDNPRRWQGPRA
jgi:hypothetical protein